MEQFGKIVENLQALGARRLMALGGVGILVMLAVGAAVIQLSRPAMRAIYSGLSTQDVGRISTILADAAIPFDIDQQRNSVLVKNGLVAQARALLAQNGLPTSARAGYELFDNIGSIGLTSFMQEVTRIRALEGEISRTIQALEGVASARVHLVLADPGSFRSTRRDASASVLLKLNGKWQSSAGQAVRHIVATAVPNMKVENVSVASTDGRMIASGGDPQSFGSMRLAEMERTMARELEEKAGRTLSTSLGAGNFQISVNVRLDVDRQQTKETTFDPKSRVERSMRVVKQTGSTEEANAKASVGVEANLPRADLKQSDADKRRQREDRREELINYELSSKSVQTVREGYLLRSVTVAAVVNKRRVLSQLGQNPSPKALEARLDELKRLIAAATGSGGAADNRIELSATDFSEPASEIDQASKPGLLDYLMFNVGSIANAIAMLGIVLVVVLLGLRPLLGILAREPEKNAPAHSLSADSPGEFPSLPASALDAGEPMFNQALGEGDGMRIARSAVPSAEHELRNQLEALVSEDEVKVAKVFKKWMGEAKQV